jgi:glutamate dehydrogenase
VLRNVPASASPAAVVDIHLHGLAVLRDAFADAVAGDERVIFDKRVAEIRDLGADDSFSKRLITLRFLDQLLEILAIARHDDVDPVDVARAYYQTSELLHVPWLRRRVHAAGRHGQWEQRAGQVLSEDLSRAHRDITAHMLRSESFGSRGPHGIQEPHEPEVARFRAMLDELRRDEASIGLAALTVAVRELTDLADVLAPRSSRGKS